MSGRTRRTMLRRVAAGVVATGGCLEPDRSGDDGTPTADSTPTGTATPTAAAGSHDLGESVTIDGTTVAVAAVATTRQIVTPTAEGRDVIGAADRQYLVVTVEGEGLSAVPVPEHLRVRAGGDRHAPVDHRLVPAEGGGLRVAVGLPLSVQADDAAVQWVSEGEAVATWRVPGSQRSTLADPPEFQSVEFEFPAEVESGGLPSFDVQVHNVGGPGPFRALVSTSTGAEKFVETSVDGGTLAGYTGHVGVDAEPGTTGTATLDWGLGEIERSFTVVDG